MKKITLNIILIIFLNLGAINLLLSQGTVLENQGKINNAGTIRINQGQANINQDTIKGRVEFLQSTESSQQAIPNMVFYQLILKNGAKKVVLDNKKGGLVTPLIVMDSLVIADTSDFTTRWIGLVPEDVQARATVKNKEAKYTGPKYIIMNNKSNSQNLQGNGDFSNLNIDNPHGVDVVEGGFKINEKLTLTSGELRNAKDRNFVMADSTLITRYDKGSLSYEPTFAGLVSITYKGDGLIRTGAEVPTNRNTLKTLIIDNKDSLVLTKNIVVNDSLIVNTSVKALTDTLELNNRRNPIYDLTNPNIEIVGNFRRNIITPGDSILLNNPYTWIKFNSVADLGQVRAITSYIVPSTFQPYLEGNEKVKRIINIFAYNNNDIVKNGFKATFNYAWRHNPKNSNDETNNLNIPELVLQRWTGNTWVDNNSIPPTVLPNVNWAYGSTDTLELSGYYTIGNSNIAALIFRAYALLEGPYIPGSSNKMTTELWKRDLLKNINTKDYPLNLVKNVDSLLPNIIPDSVVDYMVIEFRKDRNSEPIHNALVFLKYDGRIVDMFGVDRLRLSDTNVFPQRGGQYFVVLRHRNHAPVITQEPLLIIKENNTLVYDFTDPNLIEGGASSLKLVDFVDNKKLVYALKGGFIPYSAADLEALMNVTMHYTNPTFWEESWKQFTNIGYIRSDFNLSGIVTTKDFNVSWNNRGK